LHSTFLAADRRLETWLQLARSEPGREGFSKGVKEIEAVEISLEDGFAAVPAVHEVVDGALVLDAQLPGHG